MSKKFSAARKRAFLHYLAETGNQTISAERAKVSRSWVCLHRKEDAGFVARAVKVATGVRVVKAAAKVETAARAVKVAMTTAPRPSSPPPSSSATTTKRHAQPVRRTGEHGDEGV